MVNHYFVPFSIFITRFLYHVKTIIIILHACDRALCIQQIYCTALFVCESWYSFEYFFARCIEHYLVVFHLNINNIYKFQLELYINDLNRSFYMSEILRLILHIVVKHQLKFVHCFTIALNILICNIHVTSNQIIIFKTYQIQHFVFSVLAIYTCNELTFHFQTLHILIVQYCLFYFAYHCSVSNWFQLICKTAHNFIKISWTLKSIDNRSFVLNSTDDKKSKTHCTLSKYL